MAELKSITIESDEEEHTLISKKVKAKTFLGAEKKFKDKDIQIIFKYDEDYFMVLYYQ